MTKKQQNNHRETGHISEIKIMISGLPVIFVSYCGLLLKSYLCHSASGIARCKKSSSCIADALFAISTLSWSDVRNLAVRSMVMMIESLRLPLLVIFPKDIFFNKTAFLIPCYVQNTAGQRKRQFQWRDFFNRSIMKFDKKSFGKVKKALTAIAS